MSRRTARAGLAVLLLMTAVACGSSSKPRLEGPGAITDCESARPFGRRRPTATLDGLIVEVARRISSTVG